MYSFAGWVVLGVKFRVLWLLGRCSATLATPLALFFNNNEKFLLIITLNFVSSSSYYSYYSYYS
jgi:hypothetical protein